MLVSFTSAVATALLATTSLALPQNTNSASSQACNNSPSLCSREYNKILHLGAHDSSFLRDSSTGDSVAGNQFKNATLALDAGLRMLQGQVHTKDNELHLCHTSCDLLDAGILKDWLSPIADWMQKNPNDVVTILLVNSDKAPMSQFGQAFEASGLSKLGYKAPTESATGNWPTLKSMIDAKTRVVSFVTNAKYDSSVPYLLPEFDFMFETSFEVTELTGFNCDLDRPSRLDSAQNALSSNYLSLVNHFKYQVLFGNIMAPDVDNINVTNSESTATPGNLGLHLKNCKSQWGTVPNFAIVDFWDKENPLAAADSINGLSDITGRKSVEDIDSETSAGATLQLQRGLLAVLVMAVVLF